MSNFCMADLEKAIEVRRQANAMPLDDFARMVAEHTQTEPQVVYRRTGRHINPRIPQGDTQMSNDITITVNKHCDCGQVIETAVITSADIAATSDAVRDLAASSMETCTRCLTDKHLGWSGTCKTTPHYATQES
jgi:hypothetical protein